MKQILVLAVLIVTCVRTGTSQTLDLTSFLAEVEKAHPSLRAAQFEPELAEAEIRNALGRFDPVLNAQYQYKDKDGLDKINTFDAAVELPINTLFGPKVKAGFSRGLGTSVNPESSTALAGEASLGISLPLFQGIFTDARRNNLRKAYLRPELAQAQFRQERNNLLRAAAMAYWTWSEAETAVAVADTLLDLAERRLAQISRRARAGESAVIDSIEIAQEVLRRRGERFRALRMAEQARVDASVFLWNGDGTPVPLIGAPIALPESATQPEADDALISRARTLRPELRRAEVLQQTARLDQDLARELMRPFVEAEASLLSSDLAKGVGAPDYKVGFRVAQPLLFRSASAQNQVADITVQRADLQRTIIERTIDADVQNAAIAVRRALERLDAAITETDLSRLMVLAEQRRLEAGEGTLLTLNIRERFFAEALQRRVTAQADLARALMLLRWATGTI